MSKGFILLLQCLEEPVSIAAVTLAPDAQPTPEADPTAAALQPPSLKAVLAAERPNPARSTLYDAVLDSMHLRPVEAAPRSEPASKGGKTPEATPKPGASEEPEEDLGKVEDLLETAR